MSRTFKGWLEFGFAATIVLALASPAFSSKHWFGRDYPNHIWLLGYQAEAISRTGHPTLFLHTAFLQGTDVYEPWYAFYGGTLYAIGGYLSVALGSRPYLAFVLMLIAGLAMAYGGMWWLSRLLGLAGWPAHLAAVVAVTSPYLLTDLFSRAAFTEFMAICSIPLVAAGVISLLRANKWRAGPFVALLTGGVVLTGSHNITLLWSFILVGSLAAVLLALFFRQLPNWWRLVQVLAVLFLSIGINAWFLAIDLRYESRTVVSETGQLILLPAFNTVGALFTPLRTTAPGAGIPPGLTVAAPVLALVWALVVGGLSWRKAGSVDRKLFAAIVGAVVVTVGLIMCPPFWHSVGKPFTLIQFPYRLNGYVLIFCAALVIVALRMRRDRLVLISAFGVVLLSVAPAVWQVWHVGASADTAFLRADHTFDLGDEAKPYSWYASAVYADASAVTLATTRRAALPIPPPGTSTSTADVTIPAGTGPVALNVEAGPYIVVIKGATAVGRTPEGDVVIAEPDSAVPRVVQLTVAMAQNKTVRFAPVASLVSLAVALLWTLALLLRGRLPIRPKRATAGHSPRPAQGSSREDELPTAPEEVAALRG